uniref:Uncharacterized protein n=1 Tax=Ascaris lumbricoides TaxID=6252 RepID=A0A0M3HU08_ASCLU
MVVSTAAKPPGAEIEIKNLALDHAENKEILAAAKKPNRNYMSSVKNSFEKLAQTSRSLHENWRKNQKKSPRNGEGLLGEQLI